MITLLIEMLELPNFGHMTTSAISFETQDKILLVKSEIKYHVITFNSKYLYFKKPLLLTSSQLQPRLLKHSLKTQNS